MTVAADPAPRIVRMPPHSVEAEQAVIGAVLLSESAFWDVADAVNEADFWRQDHRLAWRAICEVMDGRGGLDLLTVADRLALMPERLHRGADLVGYLSEMVDATPGVSNARAYAKIIRARAELRRLITACNAIADDAFQGKDSALQDAQSRIMQIGADAQRGGPVVMREGLRDFVAELDRRQSGGTIGQPTGIPELDARWNGLQGGDLIVIAGRPSMGKTTLAMQIASDLADRLPRPVGPAVLVFSLEMSVAKLIERDLSRRSRINLTAFKRGNLDDHEWPRLTNAMSAAKDVNLQIDDAAPLTALDICARARRLHATEGVRLVVVDYLQLLTGGQGDNETQRLGDATRTLKQLARELGIPVILLSQLNRDLEKRTNRRPVMADLRGSGSIEQDADVVTFVYRDEVYHELSPDKGLAELITAKNRDGEIGTDRVSAQLHRMAFEALAHGYEPPPPRAAPQDDF